MVNVICEKTGEVYNNEKFQTSPYVDSENETNSEEETPSEPEESQETDDETGEDESSE